MKTARPTETEKTGGQSPQQSMFDLKRSLAAGADAFLALRNGESAIQLRQRRRLAELIAFSRERSPYFRKLYSSLPAHKSPELSTLPPTGKEELMESFDEWVTDPAVRREEVEAHLAEEYLIGRPYLGRYLVWTSSGTSGVHAAFVQDKRALAVMAAMSLMRGPVGPLGFFEIMRRGNRRAGLYGTGGHLQGAVLMGNLQSNPRWSRKFAGLSVLTPLEELVRKLNEFQPSVLGGYSSTLSLLAGEQQSGRLAIEPTLILSGGEGLSPQARKHMESAFSCTVRDYYGSSEASGVTFDCGHGSLHLNADWFILEAVDENYRPVPDGETSHTTLLTNLANQVQPIIRYDLGDRIAFKESPCPCGSPLPALWVEGRRNELISFTTGEGKEVRLPPRALATVMDFTPGVSSSQAIKVSPRKLRIRLDTETGAKRERVCEEARRRVSGYLCEQGLGGIEVEVDSERPSIDPATGKFRHVWSEAEPGEPATW